MTIEQLALMVVVFGGACILVYFIERWFDNDNN